MSFASPTVFSEPTYRVVLGTPSDPMERIILDVRANQLVSPERTELLAQRVIDVLEADPEFTFVEAAKVVTSTAYGTPTA